MKTSERRKLILDLLDQSEMVKTQELMKTFDTSESTIRRDLTVLAENGKIVRVHGGAIGVDLYNYGLTVEKRQIEYIEEKQKIAKTASAFVKDRELIFLDASTTVGEMIPFLAGKKSKLSPIPRFMPSVAMNTASQFTSSVAS
jgi:Transcriptional regulators of sugar metabolism